MNAHTLTHQPGLAGPRQNPNPNTRTTYRSQDWRGEAKTRTQTHTPETPARIGGVTAKPRPEHKRHTAVGSPVSLARALRQPVPCR